MTTKKEDSVALVVWLLNVMKPEMLAVQMERSLSTVTKWKKGLSVPSKGDMELLKIISLKKGGG